MPQTPERSGAHLAFLGSLAGILFAWNTVGAPKTVTLEVDGAAASVQTRQTRIDGLLREVGLIPGAGDALVSSSGASVNAGDTVTLRRAVPVAVTYGGATERFVTTAATVGDALAQMGLLPGADAKITVFGRPLARNAPLPRLDALVSPDQVSVSPIDVPSGHHEVAIGVQSATTFYVHAGRAPLPLRVYAATVGGGLKEAGVALFQADIVTPGLADALPNGQHVVIKRATPYRLMADGSTIEARSQSPTVADALREQSVTLEPGDRVTPAPEAPLTSGATVQVVRVNQRSFTEEESIPFRTQYVADAEMEIGTQRTAVTGAAGLLKREYRIHYEDGREVRRELLEQSIAREPEHAEIRYGTKVVTHAISTPDGSQQYWRTLHVWATWYSPASAGRPRSSPHYGITRTGVQARRGIIAVDPSVIPLGTRVYVPGYGVAVAGDTGGGIRGNMIDLAYGDDELKDWSTRYVDIYLLGPGPDAAEIRPPSR